MRRSTFVISLAFLTVSLTGGSCEFRAVSNNSIPQDPPPEGETGEQRTGLLIGVSAGSSSAIAATSATTNRSTIRTALAASVLSAPLPTPTPSTPSTETPSMPHPRIGRVYELAAAEPTVLRAANPIPEPGGFWLYGLGSILLAGTLRHTRRSQ